MYDFTTSHSRDGPARFLQNYSGYLHADAYTGYDAIFLAPGSGIIEVACWSHARRKFFDGVRSYPRESHQVLEWIRQWYDIEDRAHDWSVDARRELRAREANPILDKIEAYLAELHKTALPKSSLRKAVTYARNQWEPKPPAPVVDEPIAAPAPNSPPLPSLHQGDMDRPDAYAI